MADIQYLNYGDQQIEQQALLKNLADQVQGYVQKQPWSNKRKEKFMSAYSDIMNKGILGASNGTGQWMIDVGDTIDLDSMGRKDKEMYQEAAYFIQQQMAGMPTKSSQEEEKKKELDKFDFYNSFHQKLLEPYAGKAELFADQEQGWDAQDKRGDNGLRLTTNRRLAMQQALKNYLTDLEGKEYNFEGSNFKDKEDARAKIQAAIDALGTETEEDDLPAFNALGLKYRNYFSNGGNDASGYTNKETGESLTWNQYNKYQQEQAELKSKQEAEVEKQKLAQQRANQYSNFRFYGRGLSGKPLSSEHSSLEYLNGLAQKDNLNGDEQSELVGAFKLAARNNQLQNLTKEELQKFGSAYANHPNRLKKINGLNGLYWDTIGNRIIKPYSKGIQPQTSFQDILDQNNPEMLEKKRLELQNSKTLKEEDWDIIGADTVSMLGDIVSLGGGYAGAAGGLTTIVSDLYADIKRGKDFWSTAKNLAKNTAWGFAGLIPGAKLAKLGKRAAQLYALYNSYGIITDPDVHKSWKKLINGEDFTSHDFENLKWTLHAVTGAHNTVRSHFSDKALQNNLGNKNKVVVETKNGKRTITTEQQKEINKAGGRGGQEAANKKFKDIAKEEAKEGSFKFNTESRKWYNPARYSQRVRNAVSNEQKLEGTPAAASKMTVGRILVQDKNKPLIANPFSLNTYRNWWTSGGPNRGYATMALGKTYQSLNNTKQNTISQTEKQPNSNKFLSDEAKEYREVLKGNFSNNAIQGGVHKVGDLTFNVDVPRPGATNGFVEVSFKDGSKQTIRFDNQKQLQEQISKIIKERRVKANSSGQKTKIDAKEMGKILKSLKSKGLLKQGGKITDSQIDNFLKQYK